MAESTLSLKYSDFKSALTDMGVSATEADDIVQSGYRRFLNPPPIEQGGRRHRWSFLYPVSTLSLVASTSTYELEDDFGHIDGPAWFQDADGLYTYIYQISNAKLGLKQSQITLNGRPEYLTIRRKSYDGSAGQRFEMEFFPTPDQAYTIEYRYSALANKLTDANPYPLGGMEHSETILASVMAVWELRVSEGKGGRWQDYMEQLRASIEADLDNAPDFIGPMSQSTRDERRASRSDVTIQHNGVDI